MNANTVLEHQRYKCQHHEHQCHKRQRHAYVIGLQTVRSSTEDFIGVTQFKPTLPSIDGYGLVCRMHH